ncbi:hypothetical protein GCM10023200_28940 [Actinomycetospora chlora]|uniref:Uncharacterized protein n=1 Tax=Actinomycetospora chlora TaxID=663608 RepID=A0ABP9B882_9PSEU
MALDQGGALGGARDAGQGLVDDVGRIIDQLLHPRGLPGDYRSDTVLAPCTARPGRAAAITRSEVEGRAQAAGRALYGEPL